MAKMRSAHFVFQRYEVWFVGDKIVIRDREEIRTAAQLVNPWASKRKEDKTVCSTRTIQACPTSAKRLVRMLTSGRLEAYCRLKKIEITVCGGGGGASARPADAKRKAVAS